LGLTVNYSSASTATPFTRPGSVTSYQLYPGGKSYSIPSLNSTYGSYPSNIQLTADPVANPLGVFRAEGQVTLGNNVTLSGTLLAGDASADVRVSGSGVTLAGRNLPALEGSSTVYQLPVVLSGDDFRLADDCQVNVQGLALVWDEFELSYGSPNQTLNFTGRLVTAKFLGRGRDTWDMIDTYWDLERLAYQLQYRDPPTQTSITGFPEWMRLRYNFDYRNPKLRIRPNADGVQYRWQDWSQSVYVKAPGDAGLKWNVIRITPL
jgi:hypothetical protein